LSQVEICGVDCEQYVDRNQEKVWAMEKGIISARTCFRSVFVPAIYIRKLLQATYPDGERLSFKIAFEHWLLVELLNAVGGLSLA